jgi:hypothetical protein
MKVSSTYVREELAKLWPDLDMAVLLDREFIVPTLQEVIDLFKESKIRGMQVVDEFNDCDDFAQFFVVEVKLKRYAKFEKGELPKEEWAPWVLGRAAGNMFRGASMDHVVNLCLTDKGIYMFDLFPDSDRYWKAESGNDNILFFDL